MFDKLNVDGTYPCRVVLKGAVLKNGDTEDLAFTAKFNRMDQEEVNSLTQAIWHWDQTRKAIAEGRLLPNAANGVTNVSDIDWADRILGGWGDDVRDSNGDPLEYTEEEKNKVLRIEGMASAIVAAWLKLKGLDGDNEGKPPTSVKSRGNGIGK
jgi:hypothetical protein